MTVNEARYTFWHTVIDLWQASGQPKDEWCWENKLPLKTVFCKHFLEKVADKNGECCISKTEKVAGTFQTEDFRNFRRSRRPIDG